MKWKTKTTTSNPMFDTKLKSRKNVVFFFSSKINKQKCLPKYLYRSVDELKKPEKINKMDSQYIYLFSLAFQHTTM